TGLGGAPRALLLHQRLLVSLSAIITAAECLERRAVGILRAQTSHRILVALSAAIRMQCRFEPEAICCLIHVKVSTRADIIFLLRIAQANPPLVVCGID